MRYNSGYGMALVLHGQGMRSFKWSAPERRDFIAMYRMGGEL